jgi:methylmalonyl-CoA/ethylmalonyl-CoA epimerase
MIEYFSHVGHVVKDINKGINLYTNLLGFNPGQGRISEMPGGKAFMIPIGNNFVELIEPTDSEHRVGKFLEKHGEGLFHISLRVSDLSEEVKLLRAKGIIVEDPREITSLPSRPKIAFIDPQSVFGAFIELAENPRPKPK